MATHSASTTARDAVRDALQALLTRWVDAERARSGQWPCVEHDEDWPSPCIFNDGTAPADIARGFVAWRPVGRDTTADFSGIERALQCELHPSIKSFYGSFWCNPVPMRAADGALTLLQPWSERDFDRLLENLIGHAWGQQRARAPLSLFIAVTDEDDLNLCVDNTTGTVVLERPGAPPMREVAPSLLAFLAELQPLPAAPDC